VKGMKDESAGKKVKQHIESFICGENLVLDQLNYLEPGEIEVIC